MHEHGSCWARWVPRWAERAHLVPTAQEEGVEAAGRKLDEALHLDHEVVRRVALGPQRVRSGCSTAASACEVGPWGAERAAWHAQCGGLGDAAQRLAPAQDKARGRQEPCLRSLTRTAERVLAEP